MARLLVIVYGLENAREAVETVQGALANAANPFALRFAISERFAPEMEQAALSGAAPGHSAMLYMRDSAGVRGATALVTDESHFLLLGGPYAFLDKWDDALYARLRKTPDRGAVLTAALCPPDGEAPAQAYLPAFAEKFEQDGVLIERGLPLICSAAPVPTLAVDPAFVFGPISFLRAVPLDVDVLSIAAYRAGITVYALDIAPLWPLRALQKRWLKRPVENVLPGTTLSRFEQLAGFRYEHRRAGVKTTWGLFGVNDAYPQQMPHALTVSQRAKELVWRAKGVHLPLIVTAFIELPMPRKPLPTYILRFGFMKALTRLPLLLYTGGPQERLLRASFPNAWSYPDNGVLPKTLLAKGMTREQHMRRSKFYLLARAATRCPECSHVAWANCDLLKHPVCPQVLPDFTHLTDDRIHLATVNAIPDTSFMMVPVRLLARMVREVNAITDLDAELKRGFSEEVLIERLVDKHPEMFTLHPMPKKHLLMLTAFPPELLSARARLLLGDAKEPWRGEKKTPAQTERGMRPWRKPNNAL